MSLQRIDTFRFESKLSPKQRDELNKTFCFRFRGTRFIHDVDYLDILKHYCKTKPHCAKQHMENICVLTGCISFISLGDFYQVVPTCYDGGRRRLRSILDII